MYSVLHEIPPLWQTKENNTLVYICFCAFFPVPSVAPGNFRLESNSALTLDISWDTIPQDQQQGKLLGYLIHYEPERSDFEKNVTVGPNTLSYRIAGLEFASYSVIVAGYTKVGVGKFTDVLKRFPQEGGKKCKGNIIGTTLEFWALYHLWESTCTLHVLRIFQKTTLRHQKRTTLNDSTQVGWSIFGMGPECISGKSQQ